jgi:hypothetical protein
LYNDVELTSSQSLGRPEQAVLDLTVLLESRDWKSISGDAPLVATLMSVLSALLAKRQHVKEGVDYLEQEILGAILTLVEKIQSAEEIQKAHIGVEVIIKVIRGKSPLSCMLSFSLIHVQLPPTQGPLNVLCSLRPS